MQQMIGYCFNQQCIGFERLVCLFAEPANLNKELTRLGYLGLPEPIPRIPSNLKREASIISTFPFAIGTSIP